MELSLDRFEGKYAILEDNLQKLYAILKSELPKNAKPGDIITIQDDGEISINYEKTASRKKYINNLQNQLFREN